MHKRRIIVTAYLIICCLLMACGEQGEHAGLLSKIAAKNELVILTTNQPTTYYIDREGNPAGPEYDMTRSFAEMLGVQARYVVLDSTEDVIKALREGEGDIAAAGLTITSDRASEFDFGPPYMDVSEYLICHRDAGFINDIDDIKGLEIVIPTSSSYVDTLYEVFPGIDWSLNDNLITPMLLE
ncbi:MAG: transporter substrate-binding domain-containing protein, partial [Gammaproteobacteria bacterium]